LSNFCVSLFAVYQFKKLRTAVIYEVEKNLCLPIGIQVCGGGGMGEDCPHCPFPPISTKRPLDLPGRPVTGSSDVPGSSSWTFPGLPVRRSPDVLGTSQIGSPLDVAGC